MCAAPHWQLSSPGDWLNGHVGPFLGLLLPEIIQESREALNQQEGSCSLLDPNGSPSQPVPLTVTVR